MTVARLLNLKQAIPAALPDLAQTSVDVKLLTQMVSQLRG
jgi:hypothetical protein